MKNPHKCTADNCKKNAAILFKDDSRDHDTWIMFDCDTCLRDFCRDHADEDDDGKIECHDCLQQRLILSS